MPVTNIPALDMLSILIILKSSFKKVTKAKSYNNATPVPNMPVLNMLLFHIKKSNWYTIYQSFF